MRCHLIVGANLAHKPATLIPGTCMVCPPATLPTIHPAFAFSAVGIQKSEQHRQGEVSLSSFYVFLTCYISLCALSLFEPVGCRHQEHYQFCRGVNVFLLRAACNDPGHPSVAFCTIVASAIDYRSDAILRILCIFTSN